MFGLELTGLTLVLVILGGLVGLLVEVVLFKAACALTDVNDPSWPFALLIVVPFVAARGFVNWQLVVWTRPYLEGLALPLVTFVVSGLIFWLVCAVLYAAVLSVSLKKGFFTAGAQALLDALVGSLAIGVILFVLSLVQIKQGPANKAGQTPSVVPRHVS